MKLSALGSVHVHTKPEFLDEALESLHRQTLKADEVVLVRHGPLTEEHDRRLEKHRNALPLKEIPMRLPSTFSEALNAGLSHCAHSLIARFDADDVNRPDRFETQWNHLEKNPAIALVGSDMSEFAYAPDDLGRMRKTVYSCGAIRRYAQMRNPLNHPSVMFRKEAVLAVGGYQSDIPLMEDYSLWLRMLAANKQVANLPRVLVDHRVDEKTITRRQGCAYIKSEIKLYGLKRRLGFAKGIRGLGICVLRILPRLLPSKCLSMLYGFLRKAP